MQLADYQYHLPEAAIALHPPQKRGDTRMLRIDRANSNVRDGMYKQLDEYLQTGDVLVINNTKVLPARLLAHTPEGAVKELLLLEQHGKSKDHHTSLVMYRRKIRAGQELLVGSERIRVEEVFQNGTAQVVCDTDLWELASQQGSVPLPPYMHRDEEAGDRERYQTEFAKQMGSVAAPTASLNLTKELLGRLKSKGVHVVELTLHVGIGTFMPIRVDDVTKHTMHQEYFEIPANTSAVIRMAKAEGRRIIGVGTTVTRTLEYVAASLADTKQTTEITGEADIFIYPGYKFKIVDGMITNFHAPHSTVLMMAAAFTGWDLLEQSYKYALAHDYKFLSYGDSMLIIWVISKSWK